MKFMAIDIAVNDTKINKDEIKATIFLKLKM